MEYFIEICSDKKTHNFRVIAEVVLGDIFDPEEGEDEVFANAADIDQVEVEEVYVYTASHEKKLDNISEDLLDLIKEKVLEEEKRR